MNSIKLTMAAQTPSGFGMPIFGSASGVTGGTTVCATPSYVVRDRHVAGAVQGLAKGAFPGTDAWRPPTC